jgi:threonine dehydrogenase-like Zn-dependent dehydrogenase
MVAQSPEAGGLFDMDLSRDVVMGHEFCAEILDYGVATTRQLKPGTRICAMPLLMKSGKLETVGLSNIAPGGYGQQMVLSESLLLPVPNGLATELAAMTEPMSVGYHAVEMARLGGDEAPLVIGCGPVGLAVITALKLKGVGPIIAADFSSARRKLAEQVGADVVIDPAINSPYLTWADMAAIDPVHLPSNPFSVGTQYRNGVYFDCVGVPGVINTMMAGAQIGCRLVVVGLCMEQDQITPFRGVGKELNIQFVLGYRGEEFAAVLKNISEGRINVEPLITGTVGLNEVANAFDDLADPEKHAKILVDPWRG